jgi:hypothetical protein
MALDLRSPKGLHASLEACGFRRARRGAGYRRNGLRVTLGHRWLTVQAKAAPSGDPAAEQRVEPLGAPGLGAPGLWKTVVVGRRGRRKREFHLPLSVLADGEAWAEDGEEAPSPLQTCLDWAAATLGGEVPPGWVCPPRAEVESWVPPRSLAIQSGPLLRHGTIVCDPSRLALSYPLAGGVPDDLSPARRELLGRVLADAESRWRMVRVGWDGSQDRPAIRAEVDFTGAPKEVLEGLVRAGVDAIRWVVSWSLWSVALLCDTRVACRAWEGLKRKEDVSS